jgi:hypothetical protein
MDLLTVIAKYKEDVSWVNELKSPYIVYNKNIEDNHLYKNNLQNIGNEGHTFMYHIVQNYNNLNEYTAFVQGNPFDHCPAFIKAINEFKGDFQLIALGASTTYGSQVDEVGKQIIDFAKLIGFEPQFPVLEVSGGQVLLHKDVITSQPVEFYQRIIDSLEDPERSRRSGYDLEKTTFQIFNRVSPDKWIHNF